MANCKMGYLTIAYPESMPADWREKLEELPFGYVYALHDKDVDGDGKLKKSHMHFYFQGVPTARQKKYIHDSLGVHYGEDCRSANGAYDYLTHENDPDKYHYSKDSITQSSKWSQEAFETHYIPKRNLAQELISVIESHDMVEYADVLAWTMTNADEELQAEAQRYWVMRYVDSRRHKMHITDSVQVHAAIKAIRAYGEQEIIRSRDLKQDEYEEAVGLFGGGGATPGLVPGAHANAQGSQKRSRGSNKPQNQEWEQLTLPGLENA